MNIKNLKPSSTSRYKQGYINPRSCKKLFPSMKNDKIIYRSSYEKHFITWMECSSKVKAWGSECLQIPYYIGEELHHYYPDYLLQMSDDRYIIVEIKPRNQTVAPINENAWAYKEYVKNMCKWKATKNYCDARGIEFRVLTEETLNRL